MGLGRLNPVRVAKSVVKEVARAPGNIAEAIEDVGKTAKDFLKTDAGMIAVALMLPGAGALLAEQMALATALEGSALASAIGTQAAANAVGTALASVAVQTAQGVPIETAVQNAGVNAVASTGSPYAANYVGEIVNSPGVANALTSSGVSAAATLAKGGNGTDAWKNSIAAAGASGLSPEIGRTAATAVATYAVTGDAARAAQAAAAAEAGAKPKAAPAETPAPTETAPPTETAAAPPTEPAPPPVEEITVTAPREQQPAYISDVPSVGEVKVTAARPEKPTLITDIPASVTEKTDTTQPTTKEAKDSTSQPRRVGQDLFVFSGQYPSTGGPLSRALGTDLQSAGTASSPTTGLTSYRAPGEIEGEEGINRENVWNEASLRLKDALGL